MAESTWNGFLRVSLVSCRVHLSPAISEGDRVKLALLNPGTGNPVEERLVDSKTGSVVSPEAAVQGYQSAAGEYVRVSAAELDKVAGPQSQIIDIEHFVPLGAIDRLFLDEFFYVYPDEPLATDTVYTIRTAMLRKGQAGLGQVHLGGRNRRVLVEPRGAGLMLTTLRSADRVAAPGFDEREESDLPIEMIEIAESIIARRSTTADPESFRDAYDDGLRRLIAEKTGTAGSAAPTPNEPPHAALAEPAAAASEETVIAAATGSAVGAGAEAEAPAASHEAPEVEHEVEAAPAYTASAEPYQSPYESAFARWNVAAAPAEASHAIEEPPAPAEAETVPEQEPETPQHRFWSEEYTPAAAAEEPKAEEPETPPRRLWSEEYAPAAATEEPEAEEPAYARTAETAEAEPVRTEEAEEGSVAVAQEGAEEGEVGSEIFLHIIGLGERRYVGAGWAGTPGSRQPIEALSIRPREGVARNAIEFRVFARDGRATSWVTDGNYAGSWGRRLPLTGFAVRPTEEHGDQVEIVYEGYFSEGGVVGPKRDGEVCVSPIADDPLEAVLVRILDRAA
jgi:DNA end-binding protein Ku